MVTKSITGIVLAGALLSSSAYADGHGGLPDQSVLPSNVVKISDVVPMMGEHWANPANLPLGPIYCVHEGKVVCIEYMMSQEDFVNGTSWTELSGLTDLPSINHVDLTFEAEGHEGYEIPHYDLHIYFISPEDKKQIQ